MQGYHVPRRWGWDCHGLPVENEVEKELGFKTRKDIENYGIDRFNAKAKETVMRYADDWRRIIPRMGRWVDMDNDYRTMDSPYTETVWWVFKTLHEKGLIYQGFKSMHLCPRCETTLSNFEVTQGYKEITDISVFVKFKLLSEANTFLVAWTTTPWTLPGNTALAVNPEMDYTFVEITASNSEEILTGDTLVVGAREDILKRVFGGESLKLDPATHIGTFMWNGDEVAFSARRGVKGKDLFGQSYEPLFDYYTNPKSGRERLPNRDNGFRVYGADFVNKEDGTGIIHIAPAFGDDDYKLATEKNLPFIQHIKTDGTFRPEVTDFAGLPAKPKGNPRETDEKIANYLEARKKLLKREPHTHEYPHCWRCDTPLLNFASPSWFVNVSKMRGKLVEENKKIIWVPEEVGKYRFGNWLADAKDWAISRTRFWGAPIPVWGCERCKTYNVIGSLDELRKKGAETITKIILLRHGESEKNVKHILDDTPNAFPLTHEGRRKAKEAAEFIKKAGGVDVIYTSPIRRAKETAEIVAKEVGRKVEVDERFREVDSGRWDGKKDSDLTLERERGAYRSLPKEMYYQTKRGGTGESWEEVEKRMADGLSDILRKHTGETILIISHEGPIVYLLKAIDNLSLADSDSYFRKERFEEYARPITVYVDAKTGKEFDMHRPYIDNIALTCETCFKESGSGRGLMHRVEEVFDCWFESGSMPYGQAHYPFEKFVAEKNGKPFDPFGGFWKKTSGFPADFIAEGLDQTRGWFYSMLVLGVGLLEKSPYKKVVVNGLILAENGAKMSKRLKNYPDPMDIADKYSVDSLRFYLLSSPVVRGEDLRFSERGIDEVSKKVFNRLDNVLAFYKLYEGKMTHEFSILVFKFSKGEHILDKWIVARLRELTLEVTTALENYELDKAARPIADFIDDISTWYLRRSRERIKSDDIGESAQALNTLRHVLSELAKVMAPFAPFFAEYLYQTVKDKGLKIKDSSNESVHLEPWPSSAKASEGQGEIITRMKEVRRITSLALEARAKANIKVRQPLATLKIRNPKSEIRNKREFLNLIKEEINVKEVVFDETLQNEVELDVTMTPELREEWILRELVRFVQGMRKKGGFVAGESATLLVSADGSSKRFIEQNEQELSRVAFLKNIIIQETIESGPTSSADMELFQAGELKVQLSLTRV